MPLDWMRRLGREQVQAWTPVRGDATRLAAAWKWEGEMEAKLGAVNDLRTALPEHDYVSPGLAIIMPDAAFPNMIVGDTSIPRWPWLRRWVEQNWYVDRRNPAVGFASRDEASILYNSALQFQGKACLEVGCWRGWSTVHLALGAGSLDVIDPIFESPDFAESIRASCRAAGVLDGVTFHPGYSPEAIDTLSLSSNRRWSLIFIDADHEGDAPRRDAEAAMRHAEDDAMVLFHDLASPYVAAGLDAMRNAGWHTRVYQTMQIMGVAWRGHVEPVPHIPDPKVFWTLPDHLSGYEVSGWSRPNLPPAFGGWWPGMTTGDRHKSASIRAQTAEDSLATAILARAGAEASALRCAEAHRQVDQLHVEHEVRLADAIAGKEREFASILTEKNAALAGLVAEMEEKVTFLRIEKDSALAEVAADRDHRISALRSEKDLALTEAAAEADFLRRENENLHANMIVIAQRIGGVEFERDQILRRAQAAERSVGELAAANRRQEMALQHFDMARRRALAADAAHEHENAIVFEMARWSARKRVLIGLLRRSGAERVAVLRAQTAGLGIDAENSDRMVSWLGRRRVLLGLLRRSTNSAEALVGLQLLRVIQVSRSRIFHQIYAADRG